MRLEEFQNITPLDNIPSILNHAILSHNKAAKLPHNTVAHQEVQQRRDAKMVPRGLPLHQYANVYFHARNPMMYSRKNQAQKLCVLRISTRILEIPGAVITDQNAASPYVRFSSPDRLPEMDLEYVFARYWKHKDDPIEDRKHSNAKCAETLIPNRISPRFLQGAHALNETAKQKLIALGFSLPLVCNPDLLCNPDLFFH